MRKSVIAAVFAGAIASMAAGEASADTAALTSFSGGVNATSGRDLLWGWFFDTKTAINVTALGVGDADGHALGVSHDVGIFDAKNKNLLFSATVPSGSVGTLLNGFRYEGISPFALSAGSYVIIMTMPQGNKDIQGIYETSVTTSSPITYIKSAFDVGSSLAFPTTSSLFEKGIFGPNFTYASGGVPEPATWTLMLVGFGGLGAVMRRRRGQAALAA